METETKEVIVALEKAIKDWLETVGKLLTELGEAIEVNNVLLTENQATLRNIDSNTQK